MRAVLLLVFCAFVTVVAHATTVPDGYVAATVYAYGPEGQHTMDVYVPRHWCNTRIPAKVDRGGPVLFDAVAGVTCKH